ncbi:hypothetical protein [Bifidobacterium mongoliense]|uniref:hypothetical protein n=1 Tax=Bifidobacterium mongoliense TaxID=518643 RepID=UPI0030EE9D58
MASIRDDAIKDIGFTELNLADPFFSSLRNAYAGFDDWAGRKAAARERAWVSFEDDGRISSMLYLKSEDGIDETTAPSLTGKRLKIGTFKVDFNHHTSIGNRLLAIAMRQFAQGDYLYAYVTMYDTPNTRGLKRRLAQYGFTQTGRKDNEELWTKRRPDPVETDPYAIFPFVIGNQGVDYLLAIEPQYHVKMFGEVNLRSEYGIPVKDTVSINTIEKVYLSAGWNVPHLNLGDHLIPYRKTDRLGQGRFRSVVSGVCTISGVRNIQDFSHEGEFLDFIHGRSVFSEEELHRFWNSKRYPYLISFLYNAPFRRYPNRAALLDQRIINEEERIVCEPIGKQAFRQIMQMGGVDEGYLVD